MTLTGLMEVNKHEDFDLSNTLRYIEFLHNRITANYQRIENKLNELTAKPQPIEYDLIIDPNTTLVRLTYPYENQTQLEKNSGFKSLIIFIILIIKFLQLFKDI